MVKPIYLKASIITATNAEETYLNFAISNDPLTHFIIKILSTEASSIPLGESDEHEWTPITVNTETGLRTVLININDALTKLKLLGFSEEVARSALKEENMSKLLIRKKLENILELFEYPLEAHWKKDLKTLIHYIEENRQNFINDKKNHNFLPKDSQIGISFHANTGRIQLKVSGLEIDYDSLDLDYPIHSTFQDRSNLTEDEVIAIHDYIVSNRRLLFTNQDLFLKKSDTGLARSLFINEEGQVFLLRNRKQAGDPLIGEGLYKKVVFAIDLSTSELIASASHALNQDIRNEIDTLKALQHLPGTPKLIGYVSYPSKYHTYKTRLFTPYYNRGELYKNIEANTLSLEDKKRIFENLIQQVAAVHEEGYLHRDIKPQNILLSSNPQGELTPILVDYGLSTPQSDRQELLIFKGTPIYSPPECLRDYIQGSLTFPVTPLNDAWALGVTLYQLISGDIRPHPFKNHSPTNCCTYAAAFLAEHPIYDHPFDPSLKNPLDIVSLLLHRDPHQRLSVKQAREYLAQVQWYTQIIS